MEQGNTPGDLAIAGFWRRVGALVVDIIVLGLVGQLLGTALFSTLARMGGYALLIGFPIALAYYGVGNSVRMKGQTPGKMLLGVRVVDAQGGLLALPRSLLRYVVLGTPFFLSCLPLAYDPSNPVSYVLGALSGAGGVAIFYLYVFNRRTRQSLHDLAVGSYVVRVNEAPAMARFARMWRGHWVVLAVLAVLVLAAPVIGSQVAPAQFKPLQTLLVRLQAQPHVRTVGVSQNVFVTNGRTPVHTLSATIALDAPLYGSPEIAHQFAQLMARTTDVSADDGVVVSLSYGYNMGIAHGTRSQWYRYRPSELQAAEGVSTPNAASEP